MSNVGPGPDFALLRQKDPFGMAFVEKALKEQERKRAFLEEMMRKLPPGVWGQLGTFITNAVMAAPAGKLDDVFRDVEAAVQAFMKAGGTGAAGRMGLDALLNAEASPILAALEQVEKFLGTAGPKAEGEQEA